MGDPGADARAYARIRYRLLLVDLLVWPIFLLLVQGAGFSRAWAAWWRQASALEPLVILGCLMSLGGLHYAVTLPLRFYGSFLLEHRFGLSRLTRVGWLIREAKHVLVGAVLGLLVGGGFYAILRAAPTHWPLLATIGWVGFTVVLARAFPTLLLPLFYKTTPLDDASLVERLRQLCARVGLPVLGVYRFDLGAETRKANAALAGMGRTRRVLLADTLLAQFTPEEIEGVLAHELGHHRYHHILKLLGLSAAGCWIALTLTQQLAPVAVAALGLQGLADPAGMPMLALWLMLLNVAGLPLQQGISRAFEWQCDRFAIAMTDPRAFAAALRRLAVLNLADPSPPRWVVWWFFDHPPITARIHAAENVDIRYVSGFGI